MTHDEFSTIDPRELAKRKAAAAPQNLEAWRGFSKTVLQEGTIPARTKQIIAIAVAHVTQCPFCIRAHVKQAAEMGVTEQEITEAIWIAAEMRAGAAYAFGNIAMDEYLKHAPSPDDGTPKP